MAWFKFGRKAAPETRKYAPNPHASGKVRSAGFTSGDVGRLLQGWDTTSNSIDYYLQTELRELRSRSRKMVRANPYGKRFIAMIKSNVVGPNGVNVQAQTTRGRGVLDTPANDAIEAAFKDWGKGECDYAGKSTWVDLQNMAISCAGQDGEFIFRKHYTGRYGLQLQCIDPELMDINKNQTLKGGEIRLGVEYDMSGKVVAYWFRQREKTTNGYDSGKSYRVRSTEIIHGFISEWPDQSRGAPWMHSSLERTKHLEKYEEAAIVKARSTAATMAVLRTTTGEEAYEGDEDYGDGVTLDQYEAGTIKDIGNREVVNLDSDYPHQMYSAFVKSQLQGIASGLGISYHALSNDLEGVNYSSIRAGVLEDREVFKGLQNWFIRTFVCPVFEAWISFAVMKGAIKIGTIPLSRPPADYMSVHYQARRWAWVDPQKDGAANQLAIDYGLKSRSQVMREQGDDPESVWREIAREKEMMASLNLSPTAPEKKPESADESRAMSSQSSRIAESINFHVQPPNVSVTLPEVRHEHHINVDAPEIKPSDVKVDVHVPESPVNVDVHVPETEVRMDTPVVNVEVKPSDVMVMDRHPKRAIQTVDRDRNGEIIRTNIEYESE